MDINQLLNDVAAGKVSPDDAMKELQAKGVEDLGFARVDTDRMRRCALPEVIFCQGKTVGQVLSISTVLLEANQNVLATLATPELFESVRASFDDAVYHEAAQCFTIDRHPLPEKSGLVAVVTAGTSDLPVAEEACLVAERMGSEVERVYDAGVAGIHRLLPHVERLRQARVVIVVAGMEGALPSVVGGLIDRPVIAVPTSVGYGLNLDGAVALLAMMNTCVPGVTVVNINNGFGAGVAAALINRGNEKYRSNSST